MGYGVEAPALWYSLPESERATAASLTEDTCTITTAQGAYFFIAGNIEIPVQDSDTPFVWTVWVSLSEESMRRTLAHWKTPGRENDPPYFGWLSTSLPLYPETINLKTMVHTRSIGERPFIELEPTDHPLAVEQYEGIHWKRVQEIAESVLHGANSEQS